MPLLTSPIDGSPMKQINRYGIEIDICPTSGGVWLDKGELEKLMMLVKAAADEEKEMFSGQRSGHAYANGHESKRFDDSYNRDRYKQPKHKKKSALSQMMEIFDF